MYGTFRKRSKGTEVLFVFGFWNGVTERVVATHDTQVCLTTRIWVRTLGLGLSVRVDGTFCRGLL